MTAEPGVQQSSGPLAASRAANVPRARNRQVLRPPELRRPLQGRLGGAPTARRTCPTGAATRPATRRPGLSAVADPERSSALEWGLWARAAPPVAARR